MEVWRSLLKQEAEMSSRCVDRMMGVNPEAAPPRLETDKLLIYCGDSADTKNCSPGWSLSCCGSAQVPMATTGK